MEWQVKSASFLKFLGALALSSLLMAHGLGQQGLSRESQRQAALVFEQAGKTDEAEAAWRSLLGSQPNSAEAYAHLGLLEARQENYKQAIVFYRKALNIDRGFPGLRLNLGLSLFKSGDMRGAILVFEPLLKSEPGSSPETMRLVTLIGLAHFGLGEYFASIPYLRQATAADPGNLPFRMMLAQSCLWSKQNQCVLDVYREIMGINPDSAEADMLAGQAYDEMQRDGDALAQFEAAVKADPALPNVHFGYGYLLWKGRRYPEAETEFRAEIANNPEHPLAYAYLGDTEMHLNHYDRAVPDLEQAVRTRPSLTLAHLDLGIIYEGQGHNADALAELKAAEALNPNDSSIHYQLGRFYKSAGLKQKAKAEFDQTKDLLQSKAQTVQEQMHQIDPKPSGQDIELAPK